LQAIVLVWGRAVGMGRFEMNNGTIAGLAILAAVAATPAAAQDGRRVKAELGVKGVYDTNVARSSDALAAARGIDPEDMVISPTLTVDILTPVGRQALFLKGRAGYDFYDKNSVLDSEVIDLEAGVLRKVGPCGTSLSGGFKRNQTKLEDIVLEPVENTETLTSATLTVDCARTVGFSPSASVAHERSENSAATRQDLDFENSSATIGLTYSRPTFGALGIFGRAERTVYDDRVLPVGQDEDGYEALAFGVSYKRRLGARLETSVSVSQTSLDAMLPGATDFDGLTYTVDAAFRPSSRLETRLMFERSARPSRRVGADFTIDETWRGDVIYTLGPRLKVSMAAGQSESEYQVSPSAPLATLSNDRIRTVSGAVHAKFSRRLSLVFDAAWEERDASLAQYDYDSTRVGVTVAVSY
jgi:hypothetical protein